MENEAKDMKVEIPSNETEVISQTSGYVISGGDGLVRQGSITKHNCLCSPTTHAGSFRCRLHRAPSLQRTKSIDATGSQESQSKVATVADMPTQNNAVNAQQ